MRSIIIKCGLVALDCQSAKPFLRCVCADKSTVEEGRIS